MWGLKKNFALLELLERLQLCYEKEAATFLRCAEALEKEKSVSFRNINVSSVMEKLI